MAVIFAEVSCSRCDLHLADLKSQVEEPHFETSKAWEHSMVQEVQLVQFRALSLQGWLCLLVVTIVVLLHPAIVWWLLG